MNGSYAVLIDHGAVVGQGCSYDGPPTPGIISSSDWDFIVDGVCSVGYALDPPGFTNCVGRLHVVLLFIIASRQSFGFADPESGKQQC